LAVARSHDSVNKVDAGRQPAPVEDDGVPSGRHLAVGQDSDNTAEEVVDLERDDGRLG
jgi:hypothetical protein